VTTTGRSKQARRHMTAPRFINPLVRAVLGSRLHRLLSHKLVLITVRGRRTGRLHTLPVGYAQDGDTLYVLVGDYQTKRWWRNLQGGAQVQLRLRGRTVAATGSLLRWESDAEALVGALGHYLALFPAARRSLQITGRPDALDPEALRAAAHEVVMVRIRLAGDEPAATTAAVRSGTWDRPAQGGPR
jgi:deazaflavin-dependent oxidoreductase (nitroreductase family)